MLEGDYGVEKQACLKHKGKGLEETDVMSREQLNFMALPGTCQKLTRLA